MNKETRDMNIAALPFALKDDEARAALKTISEGITKDTLIPFLGPGLFQAAGAGATIPLEPETLAAELNKRAPAPGRIRKNMWSVAQFIEQRRHRKTLIAFMSDIFSPRIQPTALHVWLAKLGPSLIVDTWYDAAQRDALVAGATKSWGEIQGITRSGEFRDIWTRAYNAAGEEVLPETVESLQTLLYKPHGSVKPAANFLVADSDYVEVLTEIDIQTPIPQRVKDLRTTRGFVFIGCRFHDQMLRTYGRQIIKRSAGPHFMIADGARMSRNEWAFARQQNITVLDIGLAEAVALITG